MTAELKKIVKWLVMQGKASSQRELALQMGYNPSAFLRYSTDMCR